MTSDDHIIRQIQFDININGDESQASFGDEIAAYCSSELISVLKNQLDTYKNLEQVFIEKMSVDLGEIPERHWQTHIMEKFEKNFKVQLDKIISNNSIDSNKIVLISNIKSNKSLILSEADQLKKPENNFMQIELSRSHFEAFLFYLEKGFLPWWISDKKWNTIKDDAKNILIFEGPEMLLKKLQINKIVMRRFLNSFSKTNLIEIFNIKNKIKEFLNFEETFYQGTKESIMPQVNLRTFQILFRESLIMQYKNIENDPIKILANFINSLILHVNFHHDFESLKKEKKEELLNLFLLKIKPFWKKYASKKMEIKKRLFPITSKERVTNKILRAQTNQPSIKQSKDHKLSHKQIKSSTHNTKIIKHRKGDSLSDQNENKHSNISQAELEEGVYVNYAGIILIHPFLEAFFQNLYLYKNGDFEDENSLAKAIKLLAYLSSGSDNILEHECLLFKHLLGISWDAVIDLEFQLTEEEKDQANNLLNSVLEHWKALKSSSIEALQATFFQRHAKLWKDQTSWQLHIEQKAQDILLKELPWGIGIIKFPWMKNLLLVNWV